jgi:hypothetical protein
MSTSQQQKFPIKRATATYDGITRMSPTKQMAEHLACVLGVRSGCRVSGPGQRTTGGEKGGWVRDLLWKRHMRTTTLKWEVAATAGGSRVEARRKRGGEMGWDAGRWCPAGFSLRGGVMGFRLEQ